MVLYMTVLLWDAIVSDPDELMWQRKHYLAGFRTQSPEDYEVGYNAGAVHKPTRKSSGLIITQQR